MKIIAVDPGYDRVGIAILEKSFEPGASSQEILLHSETFQTDKKALVTERLCAIGKRIEELAHTYQVEYLAIEQLFFNTNQTTAMRVAEARGIIIYAASQGQVGIREFTPVEIKVAVTGNGRADKKAVAEMVQRLVVIPPRKRLDDEFDAIACGVTFFAHYRLAQER